MLSRIAQAPRLGLATASLARPSASPLLRTRITNGANASFVRTFAKKGGLPRQFKDQSNKPAGSTSSNPAQDAAKDAAKSTSSPKEDVSPTEKESSSDAAKEGEPIPFHKLPDLTQGIPSTFEQEMNKEAGRTQSALETVEQESSDREKRERYEYVSTSDRNRQWWARFFGLATLGGFGFGVAYLGRNWDNEIESARHPDVPDGWNPVLWWQRARARMTDSVSYYQEPAFDKLLPDPDPSFERPYTLCLSLDDLLVHSEWSREHGWRVAKRPGVDYFIRYLSQYYELVLFTTVPFAMGEPVVRKLDPFRFIMWPLYREATKYEEGEIVKDLSYLNRDLSKVIIIDTEKSHVRKQPENAIVLKPWKGESGDKDLVGLIPFLEYIHTMQYSDVRKVLKSFEGQNIPTEFARREAIARKEFNSKLEQQKSKHSKPSGFAALGSAFGLKSSNMSMTMAPEGEQNPTEAFAQGKMLQDIARERGQRNYELLEKEIRENGEKWLKEEAAMMEKAQQEAMNSMFKGGLFGGGAGGEEKKN